MFKWLRDNRTQLLIGILVYIVGSVILAAFTKFNLNRKILNVFFVDTVQIPSSIITTGVLIILILFLLVVTLWESKKSAKNSLERSNNLKHIQFPAKLGTLELEKAIFTFEINFEFDPEIQYNPSNFAEKIYISKHYVCANPDCNSVLIEDHIDTHITKIVCSNDVKHFDMNKNNEFFILSRKVEGYFKGTVLKDYDKYWKIYKAELNRATNNKLQDFSHRWD